MDSKAGYRCFRVTAADIRKGALDKADVVVMGGGKSRLAVAYDVVNCRYNQGPLLGPDDKRICPPMTPWQLSKRKSRSKAHPKA